MIPLICQPDAEDPVEHSETLGEGGTTSWKMSRSLGDCQLLLQPEPYRL